MMLLPFIGMRYNTPQPFELSYHKTKVIFNANCNIEIYGNVKDAAKAVFFYLLNNYNIYNRANYDPCGYCINGVSFDWRPNFTFRYVLTKPDAPDNFLKIEKEFNKLKETLMVFI